ncbi:MAG: GFA family protein [Pseudomonadota bacterium]
MRFATTGDPKFVANCHCRACRRATGAAFSTWVGFTDDKARWLTRAPSFFESSPGVSRGYCAECGTPLTYASNKWPGEIHFLIGVFDRPDQFTPMGDAFAEEGLEWAPRVAK